MITLKTLPESTEQEVFNQVKSHLMEQGKASKSKTDGTCKYRAGKDLKCAAGCLMSDDEYTKNWDKKIWTWMDLVDRGLVPDTHNKLIRRLQFMHDTTSPNLWDYKLGEIADVFGLENV